MGLLPYAIFIFIIQIITLILVGIILFFILKAYRFTRQSFLITFFIGFSLLEISLGFVVANRFFGNTAIVYHGSLWIHEIIQTLAFGLLAITYYFRGRNLTRKKTIILGTIFISALSVAFFVYFSTPPSIASTWRGILASYLYAISLGFLGYVIIHVARSLKSTGKSDVFIPSGFGILAVGQIMWIYWSLTDLGIALVLANMLLVVGLALLALAVALIWRR